MTGTQQLRAQLEAMKESLRAFDDPIVDQTPGLRLMHHTLRERESHIEGQIRKNETCSIELALAGAAKDGQAIPVSLVALLLQAVDAAVAAAASDLASQWPAPPPPEAVAEAVALQLAEFTIDGDEVTLLLTRTPGALASQLAAPADGVPLVEQAAASVSATLAHMAQGHHDPELPEAVSARLREAGRLLAAHPVTLRWSLEPFHLKSVELEIDRVAAQRLIGDAPTG